MALINDDIVENVKLSFAAGFYAQILMTLKSSKLQYIRARLCIHRM